MIDQPAPRKVAENLVEMLADDDEKQAFDQPCLYGNRLGGHSVYCHHPDDAVRQRKCLYRWCSRKSHERNECGGYTPNPAWTDEMDVGR